MATQPLARDHTPNHTPTYLPTSSLPQEGSMPSTVEHSLRLHGVSSGHQLVASFVQTKLQEKILCQTMFQDYLT